LFYLPLKLQNQRDISRSIYFFLGQFGPIDFSVSVFLGFMIATFTSILDSIGDYYACASMCRVPPPPSHAVNRGIAIEGFCSAIAGLLGCGHATTTYGGNIGAIGVTRVGFYSNKSTTRTKAKMKTFAVKVARSHFVLKS
jgi:nucleobase transporter 1/2